MFFLKKVETIQYKAARIITGAWKGTDMIKLYNTLGWESLNGLGRQPILRIKQLRGV